MKSPELTERPIAEPTFDELLRPTQDYPRNEVAPRHVAYQNMPNSNIVLPPIEEGILPEHQLTDYEMAEHLRRKEYVRHVAAQMGATILPAEVSLAERV